MQDSPRTCVITGASSGIGLATAVALAREGHRLIMVCRPSKRATAALAQVTSVAQQPPQMIAADLSSLAAAREAAREIVACCDRLDVVIHNAGVWPMRRELTVDGFETAFAVNHLAPFVINELLLPKLATAPQGRLVQVTAGLAIKGRINPERTPRGDDFHRIRTYADTKLWNLLTTLRLAESLQEGRVTVNAVHPGVVRTRLGASFGLIGALLWLVKRFWLSPEQGARGPVHLATSDELTHLSGRLYDQLAFMEPWPTLQDASLREKVVAQTRRLVAGS